MMLRFDQYPPEVFALTETDLYKIIAYAEARAGFKEFDLSEKIVVQLSGLIEVFLEKDILRCLGKNLLFLIKLVSELGEECPDIEGGRHTVRTAEINGSNKEG
jgi:hypothetical protein